MYMFLDEFYMNVSIDIWWICIVIDYLYFENNY